MRKIIIGILVVAIISFTVWSNLNSAEKDNIIYGNVDIREASLAFEIPGRVSQIFVKEGALVKEGDVLAQLNIDSLKLERQKALSNIELAKTTLLKYENGNRKEEIDAAKALVDAAKANVTLAEVTYNRKIGVFKNTKGTGISKAEVDEAKAKLDSSVAEKNAKTEQYNLLKNGSRYEDVKIAQQNVIIAENNLALIDDNIKKATLLAPSNGVIRNRYIELGDMTSSAKKAFALALNSEKRVRAYATYNKLSKIQYGNKAKVKFGNNEEVEGVVTFISDVAEFTPKNVETEELRTNLVYEIQITVTDEQNKLHMGMPVTVDFEKL